MRRARVITVSDGVSRGERNDASGRLAQEMLSAAGFDVPAPGVVSDDRERIAETLRATAPLCDLLVTTGGTGLGPRDVTPEATRDVLDREAPGISELLRATGCTRTPLASLSRGVAGVVGRCLVVNLPGSPKAVLEGLDALLPIVNHALQLLAGQTEHG